VTSNSNPLPPSSRDPSAGRGRLSVRFRNINIILFLAAFCIMTAVMATTFGGLIRKISFNNAGRYAASSAEALSAHVARELSLVARAARSGDVIEWLKDEGNHDKKVLAYNELSGILGELYSNNLYVGIEKSRNEYRVEKDYEADNIRPFKRLNEDDPDEAWYFEGLASDSDYLLNVAIDDVRQKKRVWLNYRIVRNGILLGMICTGLEFSHVAGELFSQYENRDMRGLIVDKNGFINIDSSLMHNEEFLYNDFESHIEKKFSDTRLLSAIKSHLDGIEGYFETASDLKVVELPQGPYRYMTIAPIRFTDWSAIILYDSSSLLDWSLFMPTAATLLFLLIAFALSVNAVSYRLIFLPLGKLEHSLARLKENSEERVYGTERDDELGLLSNTIQDLFTQANHDALTGLHNRWSMENHFRQVMRFLSRSNGSLSVLMLDVDYFKRYNDAYGHEQGDACLIAVSGALAGGITRGTDFTARYGGEEFIAVLPYTDEAGGRLVAEKLLARVRKLNLPHGDSPVATRVTVSIGVTTGKVMFGHNWEDYVKRADDALYMSKQNGRDRFTYLDFVQPGQGA